MRLVFDNITKRYKTNAALSEVSLELSEGVYAFLGPNGAGKSTLIRHLTGIYRQDEGELLINGEPVYENTAVKKTIAGIHINVNVRYFQNV